MVAVSLRVHSKYSPGVSCQMQEKPRTEVPMVCAMLTRPCPSSVPVDGVSAMFRYAVESPSSTEAHLCFINNVDIVIAPGVLLASLSHVISKLVLV